MIKLYLPKERIIAFYALTYWVISHAPANRLEHKYLSVARLGGTRCDALRRKITTAPEHDPKPLNDEESLVLSTAIGHWLNQPPPVSTYDVMTDDLRSIMANQDTLIALRTKLIGSIQHTRYRRLLDAPAAATT